MYGGSIRITPKRTWRVANRQAREASIQKLKRRIGIASTGLLLAAATGISAAPAQASQADGNYATCQSGTTAVYWTGKDPSECQSGTYTLYKDDQRVLQMEPTKDGWAAMKKEYAAAQKWCSDNALTCTVITGVGIALVNPLISAATS